MPTSETCGTVHGIVRRMVDGEVKHFCVHDAKGTPVREQRQPVVEYPDRR